jgi:hypothetical protein
MVEDAGATVEPHRLRDSFLAGAYDDVERRGVLKLLLPKSTSEQACRSRSNEQSLERTWVWILDVELKEIGF